MNSDLVARIRDFIESEARSCSMDPGCITPEYVYRMFGARVSLEEIKEGLRLIKQEKKENESIPCDCRNTGCGRIVVFPHSG